MSKAYQRADALQALLNKRNKDKHQSSAEKLKLIISKSFKKEKEWEAQGNILKLDHDTVDGQ